MLIKKRILSFIDDELVFFHDRAHEPKEWLPEKLARWRVQLIEPDFLEIKTQSISIYKYYSIQKIRKKKTINNT